MLHWVSGCPVLSSCPHQVSPTAASLSAHELERVRAKLKHTWWCIVSGASSMHSATQASASASEVARDHQLCAAFLGLPLVHEHPMLLPQRNHHVCFCAFEERGARWRKGCGDMEMTLVPASHT